MKDHFGFSDDEFEEQLQKLTLDPVLFTDEAHVRLAWIHVRKYGEQKAIKNICAQIKRFDKEHGNGAKYHETLTVAAVKVVGHFFAKSQSENFQAFLEEFPRVRSQFKNLIEHHYSKIHLQNEHAKATYIEPDLLPF